jgi:hypothetical protein
MGNALNLYQNTKIPTADKTGSRIGSSSDKPVEVCGARSRFGSCFDRSVHRVQFMSISQNKFLSKLVFAKTGFSIYFQISQYLKSESETKIEFLV